jgi:hypothetical protein
MPQGNEVQLSPLIRDGFAFHQDITRKYPPVAAK